MADKKLNQLNHNVSVDCVIFGFTNNRLKVLLIEREGNYTHKHEQFALPGDLIYDKEDLSMAANRVLEELTGLKDIFLKQIGAFGNPDRLMRQSDIAWLKATREKPQVRVITIAYYSLVRLNDFSPKASSFARSVHWHDIHSFSDLAFDHYSIFEAALNQLRNEIKTRPIGFNLMPPLFTLGQLQKMYEAILDKPLDKRNFRRKILKLDILNATNKKEQDVSHKPAQYFTFNLEKYKELRKTGFDNFGF